MTRRKFHVKLKSKSSKAWRNGKLREKVVYGKAVWIWSLVGMRVRVPWKRRKKKTARVKYSYPAGSADELTLTAGDRITISAVQDHGQGHEWLHGSLEDGRSGIFPANYVKMKKDRFKKRRYEGVVSAWLPETRKHRVHYDDGDVRDYNMSKQKGVEVFDLDTGKWKRLVVPDGQEAAQEFLIIPNWGEKAKGGKEEMWVANLTFPKYLVVLGTNMEKKGAGERLTLKFGDKVERENFLNRSQILTSKNARNAGAGITEEEQMMELDERFKMMRISHDQLLRPYSQSQKKHEACLPFRTGKYMAPPSMTFRTRSEVGVREHLSFKKPTYIIVAHGSWHHGKKSDWGLGVGSSLQTDKGEFKEKEVMSVLHGARVFPDQLESFEEGRLKNLLRGGRFYDRALAMYIAQGLNKRDAAARARKEAEEVRYYSSAAFLPNTLLSDVTVKKGKKGEWVHTPTRVNKNKQGPWIDKPSEYFNNKHFGVLVPDGCNLRCPDMASVGGSTKQHVDGILNGTINVLRRYPFQVRMEAAADRAHAGGLNRFPNFSFHAETAPMVGELGRPLQPFQPLFNACIVKKYKNKVKYYHLFASIAKGQLISGPRPWERAAAHPNYAEASELEKLHPHSLVNLFPRKRTCTLEEVLALLDADTEKMRREQQAEKLDPFMYKLGRVLDATKGLGHSEARTRAALVANDGDVENAIAQLLDADPTEEDDKWGKLANEFAMLQLSEDTMGDDSDGGGGGGDGGGSGSPLDWPAAPTHSPTTPTSFRFPTAGRGGYGGLLIYNVILATCTEGAPWGSRKWKEHLNGLVAAPPRGGYRYFRGKKGGKTKGKKYKTRKKRGRRKHRQRKTRKSRRRRHARRRRTRRRHKRTRRH